MTTATQAGPRIVHAERINPAAIKGLYAFSMSARDQGVPLSTLHLVEIRASQINGCAVCLDMHTKEAKKDGDTDERLFAVAAWRDTSYFTDAERAALALTEAMTRIADSSDPVPDEVWDAAAEHYDDRALVALVVAIAGINTWNRLNVSTRQQVGAVEL